MLTRKARSLISICIFGIVISIAFNNCSVVRPPQLTNRSIAKATFFHTGAETSCLSCHYGSRPQNPVGPSYLFDHTVQAYGGGGDCISCHTENSWVGGTYKHSPRPKECLICHEAQRPPTPTGNPLFDHKLNGLGDCYGCHAQSTTQFNTMSDWSGAHAMPSDLIGYKNISVTAGAPTFSETIITSVTSATQVRPLQMLHTSNQIPSSAVSKCEGCHATARISDYTKGVLHKSLSKIGVADPTACISCHVNTSPVGFVGPRGAGRVPASAEMRHEAVVWKVSADGKSIPSPEKIVNQDCAICHGDSVGDSWGEATYHASLKIAKLSQPTSCLDCHANNRPPNGSKDSKFDHSKAGGMGDCYSCHKNTEKNNYRSWVGTAEFSHAEISKCMSCHEGVRPINSIGWTQMGWSSAKTTFPLDVHAKGVDCNICHEKSIISGKNPTVAADWQGGAYSHDPKPSSCLGCHSVPTSDKQPDLSGTGISFKNHDSSEGQDCIGCHNKPPNYTNLSGWTGVSSVPAGLVNGTGFDWNFWTTDVYTLKYQSGAALSTARLTKTTVKLPQQILHSSAQIPSALLADCKACHTNGTAPSSGAKLHAAGSSANLKTCNECHKQGGLPVGVVMSGASSMNHFEIQNTECLVCHKTNIGSSWKTGSFHTNAPDSALKTCLECHLSKMPKDLVETDSVYTPDGGVATPQHFSHFSAVVKQDCSVCHSREESNIDWINKTKIHRKILGNTMSNCGECHSTDVSKTAKFPIGNARDSYLHSPNFSSKDCISCHGTATGSWVMNSSGTIKTAPAQYSNVGVTWSNAFYDHVAPNGSSIGSCGSCHNTSGFYSHGRVPASTRNRPCNTCH